MSKKVHKNFSKVSQKTPIKKVQTKVDKKNAAKKSKKQSFRNKPKNVSKQIFKGSLKKFRKNLKLKSSKKKETEFENIARKKPIAYINTKITGVIISACIINRFQYTRGKYFKNSHFYQDNISKTSVNLLYTTKCYITNLGTGLYR